MAKLRTTKKDLEKKIEQLEKEIRSESNF